MRGRQNSLIFFVASSASAHHSVRHDFPHSPRRARTRTLGSGRCSDFRVSSSIVRLVARTERPCPKGTVPCAAPLRVNRATKRWKKKYKKAQAKKLVFGVNPLHVFFLLLFFLPTAFTVADYFFNFSKVPGGGYGTLDPAQAVWRTKIRAFYEENNPSKVGEIPELLRKVQGQGTEAVEEAAEEVRPERGRVRGELRLIWERERGRERGKRVRARVNGGAYVTHLRAQLVSQESRNLRQTLCVFFYTAYVFALSAGSSRRRSSSHNSTRAIAAAT